MSKKSLINSVRAQIDPFAYLAFRSACAFGAWYLCATAETVGQDRTLFFDVEAVGESKSIAAWGLDTAWLSEVNVARGVEFVGRPQVDVIRFSFTGDKPLIDGDLEASRQAEFDERMRIVNAYSKPDAALYFNNDSDGIDAWFKSAGGGVRADRWAQLIALTAQKCEEAGREVVSVAPFNEPDFGPEQGNGSRLREICSLFRSDAKYIDQFSGIRLCGPSTLNTDQATSWYSPLHDVLDEGNTHQLAGSFDSYASFFQFVESKGDFGANDELHNVMEAMVGAEYGMDAGIWWGTAELARGEFVKASDGMRLGYSEHRQNWTAASVYRAPDGKVQAFLGASERQATSTSYRFVSKAREVYFDGHGPFRSYVVEVPGGNGYWIDQPNAEKVVHITWGDDIQPAIKGRYTIVNRQSGKVLEVAAGSSENGANLQQNEATGEAHQLWDVNPLDARHGGDYSYFSLRAAHSGKSADVWGWSLVSGGDVRTYDNTGSENQEWFFEYVEDGYFHIRSRWSGKYLEAQAGSLENGANIWQADGTGGLEQQWRLVPVGAAVEFTRPSAPVGLAAKANVASISLRWEANDEADLNGYNIYRSEKAGESFELIARGVAGNSFIDGGAYRAGPYYYRLRAVDHSLNRSEYSNEVVAAPLEEQGLILALGFENNGQDDSGNANDAILSSGAGFLSGKVGSGALYFNGVSSHAQLPASVAKYDDLTIASWVHWSGGADEQRVFAFGNGAESQLYLTPKALGGGLRFGIRNGGVEQQVNGAALQSGAWTHVAVTLGQGNARLYVDGAQVEEIPGAIKPSDIGPVLNLLGMGQEGSEPLFTGKLDDFKIYNYALDAVDVASLAGVGPPRVPEGLAAALGGTQISLSWSPSPGAMRYRVMRSVSLEGAYTAVANDLELSEFVDTDISGSSWFYYSVIALNDAGESLASDVFAVSLLSPAEEWRVAHFEVSQPAGDAADDADPDGDGIANLLERAFGSDPWIAEQESLPYIDESRPLLALVYRMSSDATDLVFEVVESSSLNGSWSLADGTSEVLQEDDDGRWVRFSRPIDGSEALFLSLRVRTRD